MNGIIAGDIIGSPYKTINIKDPNDFFFKLFDEQLHLEPIYKTRYGKERMVGFKDITYYCHTGRMTDAVTALHADLGAVHGKASETSLGGHMCQALTLGRLNGEAGMTPQEHAQVMAGFVETFPESMHGAIMSASDAAFNLVRTKDADSLSLYERMGADYLPLSQMTADDRAAIQKTDGRSASEVFSDAFSSAVWAVGRSHSWEEAVRRAVALGGDSSLVGAFAGGLAEAAFGVPEPIAARVNDYLTDEQRSDLEQTRRALKHYGRGEAVQEAVNERNTKVVELKVLSLPGRASVYAVPEGRPDIEAAIKSVNKDCKIVPEDDFRALVQSVNTRRDSDGNVVSGTFIDSERPSERTLYYDPKSRKLYSSATLPDGLVLMGFPKLEKRMEARNEFRKFAERAAAIRDEQERSVGHNPADGHLCFSKAYYIQIEQERVLLMKGGITYGEFGLDSRGLLRVNSNTIGGTYGKEGLASRLENHKGFYKADGPAEVLGKLQERCLDIGFQPEDPSSSNPIYDNHIASNMEMMLSDLAEAGSALPKAELPQELDLRRTATKTRRDFGESSEAKTFAEAVSQGAHKGAVFTVGHSNLELKEFVANLKRHGITEVRDIRSRPKSSFPHFNGDELKSALEAEGITYIFNGKEMGSYVRRTDYPDSADGLTFTRSEGGYAQRTKENAQQADLTIAFAADFDTAGEKATINAAGDSLIKVELDGPDFDAAGMAAEVWDLLTEQEKSKPLVLNIAGNTLFTLKNYGISQENIDNAVTSFIGEIRMLGMDIRSIRSGGQTGADQAGIVAAKTFGIPAVVHGTRDWKMRGEDGMDISSEAKFKSRFLPSVDYLSYREIAQTPGYQKVYDEIIADARKGVRQALLCAETAPEDCHRFALVGVSLAHPDAVGRRYDPIEVQHIKRNGLLVSHNDLERKLMKVHRTGADKEGVQAFIDKMDQSHHNTNAADKPHKIVPKPEQSNSFRRK